MAGEVSVTDLARTGPDTIGGRYLRRFWHPVLESGMLKPGQALPIRVMGEDWTLYRGAGGTPHVIGPRCAHRNSQLSVGWVEGEALRCFYHGWKYDGAGRCIEQPGEREPFADKVRLRSQPARDYLGLVFAYFGPGEPPALPRYPEFEDFEGELYCWSSRHDFNYFSALDNLLDATHIGFVHSNHAGGFDGRVDSPFIEAEETCWGATSRFTRPSGKVGQTQFGMPNIFHVRMFPIETGLPPREVMFWFVPVDDENYQRRVVEAIRMPRERIAGYLERRRAALKGQTRPARELAAEVVAGRLRREDVDQASTAYFNFVDDVAQLSQGRIHDRTQERLGGADTGVRMLRSIWLREMQALKDGRPLKDWRYDPGLPLVQADE